MDGHVIQQTVNLVLSYSFTILHMHIRLKYHEYRILTKKSTPSSQEEIPARNWILRMCMLLFMH